VQPNTEVRSRKYCCSGKVVNVIYSESAFVAFDIQQPVRMRLILRVLLSFPVPNYSIFHIIS